MAFLHFQSVLIDVTDSDAAITTAVSTGLTYNTIHAVSIMPVSNTKAKVIVAYQ